MNKSMILIVLAALMLNVVFACIYDSECGANGRCVNNQCLQTAECTRHLDCLKLGLYYECDSHNRCVKSTHKICRSNEDCKKNVLHKTCKADRCT